MSQVQPKDVRRKILVVEDDRDIQNLLTKALEGRYEVGAVGDGNAALTTAEQWRPDLVLLDVTLPGLDGFSVAESLKKTDTLKKIPIIFLTARDRPSDTIRGIQVGARHYVTKPFKLEALLSKIEKALGG